MKMFKNYTKWPVDVKATFWFTIMGFIQKAMAIVTTPIFTRLLTVEEYGIYNIYNTWHDIFSIFATLNLSAGVFMRGLVKFEDDRKEFIVSIVDLGMVCWAVCVLIYTIFKNQFNKLTSLTTYMIYAMFIDILVCMFLAFWSANERVDFKYVKLIIITLSSAVVRPIVGIIAIKLSSNGVAARVLSIVAVNTIFYSVLLVSLYKGSKTLFSKKYWRYGLKFNLPLLPHYLSQVILAQSDLIMIGRYAGNSEAGKYGLASTVAKLMLILNTAIINSLNPYIYKKIDESKYGEIGAKTTIYLILISVANLLLMLFSPELIAILGSEEYKEAIYAIPPISMGMYFLFMYSLFAAFEFYFERTKFIMFATSMSAIMNIILNRIFIPQYGYIAAAYTTLFCYIVYVLFHYLFMDKILKEKKINIKVYDTKKIIEISALFMICGFAILISYNYLILRVTLFVIMMLVVLINKNKVLSLVNNYEKNE